MNWHRQNAKVCRRKNQTDGTPLPNYRLRISVAMAQMEQESVQMRHLVLANSGASQIMSVASPLGEAASMRCRRSNRPGNSQAKGPAVMTELWREATFHKDGSPKG